MIRLIDSLPVHRRDLDAAADLTFQASSDFGDLPPKGATLLDLDDQATQAALTRFHDELGAHVTARLPWLQAWRYSHPRWKAWALALLDDAGELRAVAPLALGQRGGVIHVSCLGHTALDCSPVFSRTAHDAADLADEIARALARFKRPWTIDLPHLAPGGAFTTSLARHLRFTEIRPDAERPIVLLDGSHDPRAVISRNQRSAEAKARNRIARAGLAFEARWITDPLTISGQIPEIRSVHRARDLQLRGSSLLDHPEEGAFYDALLRRHAGTLELLEIRLNGDLAAYVLWIRNRAERLVLDNRVAPRWTLYSAGLIANNLALHTAAADPAVAVLDWGSGVQRYKLQSANKVMAHDRLFGWSSQATRRALAARQVLGRAWRSLESRGTGR